MVIFSAKIGRDFFGNPAPRPLDSALFLTLSLEMRGETKGAKLRRCWVKSLKQAADEHIVIRLFD